MTLYVALLRAINVGRTGKVGMAELCKACEAAGFSEVESYINSGNLLFATEVNREQATAILQGILEREFALSANRVILRTPEELQRAVNLNPFPESAANSPAQLHVHFLAGEPKQDADLMITTYKGPERVRRVEGHVYIDYAGGVGNSALTAGFFEKALGCVGTARNWNTCLKLLAMAQQRRGG